MKKNTAELQTSQTTKTTRKDGIHLKHRKRGEESCIKQYTDAHTRCAVYLARTYVDSSLFSVNARNFIEKSIAILLRKHIVYV